MLLSVTLTLLLDECGLRGRDTTSRRGVLRPGKDVAGERAGESVRLWAVQVLVEYVLGRSGVLGAEVYCGSDVKLAFTNIDGVPFEWCVPHLLNKAVLEDFGLPVTSGSSKFPGARAVITTMKKGIHFQKKVRSHKDKMGCDTSNWEQRSHDH